MKTIKEELITLEKEELITLETALLLEEKGIIINTGASCWVKDLEGNIVNNADREYNDANNRQQGYYLARPTQTSLQRLLRKKYNLDVLITKENNNEYNYYVWGETRAAFDISKTYEEALEKGLQEGIKLIEL